MASRARQAQIGTAETIRREIGAVALAVAGGLGLLAILSYEPGEHGNLIGPLGGALADVAVQALGLASLFIPAALLAAALATALGRAPYPAVTRVAAGCGALVCSAVLCQLVLGTWRGMEAGGLIGGFLALVLRDGLGGTGAWVITATSGLVLLCLATGQSLGSLAAGAGKGAATVARGAGEGLKGMVARGTSLAGAAKGEPIELRAWQAIESPNSPAAARRERPRSIPVVVERPALRAPTSTLAERTAGQVELPLATGSRYRIPEQTLFDPPVANELAIDREALIASSRVLQAKLGTFDVHGEVRGIHPGPVITTYEFEPAPGIKVQRVVSLADDLAMAMRAMSVRILAPIPGKSVVGIEVSNARRERVLLREIVASDAFQGSASVLTLALGKDTTGNPVAGDLARMPHLLVAGATGAGKSVFLNSLVTSVLMRATPRDVRFVMVDPKMLELSTYEHIPHLLVPVITDAKPAVVVLNNLVEEMNSRYRVMRDKGVRGIEAYNRMVAEESERAGVIELSPVGDSDDEDEDEGEEQEAQEEVVARRHEHLPRIVVIIDELADLIMNRRDCETPITLLAQKARAAGIHMVVATQRPSVDVITGLIKANFPARISFQVAGKVDSRTILDSAGAERLLGEGDMLFLPPGTSKLQRLHGAYVSDDEIQRITDFVRSQSAPAYSMSLLEDPETSEEAREVGDEPCDTMYDEAVSIVTETGKASISYLQRRLQVGYNRAARMIERMEQEGVVSAADHRGAREVVARSLKD